MHSYQVLVDICEKLQGLSVRVHVIPDMFALSFPNAELDGFGGIPVIDLGLAGLQGMERFEKRIFDVLIASIILVILSPVLLLLALADQTRQPGAGDLPAKTDWRKWQTLCDVSSSARCGQMPIHPSTRLMSPA